MKFIRHLLLAMKNGYTVTVLYLNSLTHFFQYITGGKCCNDVTIASTGLRSAMRTDILDACTRVMLRTFTIGNLQLY